MNRPKIRIIPDEALLQFVKLDTSALGVLRINFDGLCQYLIHYEARNFIVADFERILMNELETKLKGKPVSADALKSVCRYIDSLSKFLTFKKRQVVQGDFPDHIKREFFEKHRAQYKDVLEKTKHRNPREYNILLERFRKRFESDK